MSVTDKYLGIDIGTSSLKVVVVDATGHVLAREGDCYSTSSPSHGVAEQNPQDWLIALKNSLARIDGRIREGITAIGVVGQVPTLVLVDSEGVPIRPAITWQDLRATTQAASFESEFGDATHLFGTSLPWAPNQLPAKLRWVSENEPAAADRTRWLLQPKDYVCFELTGEISTDSWSSKGICRIPDGEPVAEIIDAAGFSAENSPHVHEPWATQGTVTRSAARHFGLPEGTPVAAGWSDALAAMLAIGAFEKPTGFLLTGTSDIAGVSARLAEPADGLYHVPATVAPLELSYGPTQSSGASLNWIAGVLGLGIDDALCCASEASAIPGPTFVPYINGERAPLWNTDVRGAFLGLDSRHENGHVVRSVLHGVAFSANHIIERAQSNSAQAISEMHIGGRGTENAVLISSRLRALRLPLALHEEESLSALGAAMLGAMTVGVTLHELSNLRRAPRVISPSESDHEGGRADYANYLEASKVAIEWSMR